MISTASLVLRRLFYVLVSNGYDGWFAVFGECPSIIMLEGLTIVGHAQLSRVYHEYLSNWSLNSIIKRNLRVDKTLTWLKVFLVKT